MTASKVIQKAQGNFADAEMALAKAFVAMVDAAYDLHVADPGVTAPAESDETPNMAAIRQRADATHAALLSVFRGAAITLTGTLDVAAALDHQQGPWNEEELAERVMDLLETLTGTMLEELQDELSNIIATVQEQRPAIIAQIAKLQGAS
jgi:hypothetical protein